MKSDDWSSLRRRIERLEWAFAKRGREFARMCGVGETTIGRIKDRDGGMRMEIADKIQKATGCNLEWLLTGRGDWSVVLSRANEVGQTIAERTSPRPHRAVPSERRIKKAKGDG